MTVCCEAMVPVSQVWNPLKGRILSIFVPVNVKLHNKLVKKAAGIS